MDSIGMLFVGIPVELQEAYRILGANVTITEEKYDYGAELSEYLEQYDISIYYIDQGVCVIGKRLDTESKGLYYKQGEFITYISNMILYVTTKLQAAGANLSQVRIAHIHDESKCVEHVKPMVLTF